MKLFKCQVCDQLLYFENTKCEKCDHVLGYLPDQNMLSALEPDGDQWRALAAPRQARFMFCANAAHDACNWLVPTSAQTPFCRACEHNRTIPDLSDDQNRRRWQELEVAKHRLFYSLLRLKLPMPTRQQDPEHGLAFDFLADPPDSSADSSQDHVLTGHADGLVTIALLEADDAERERRRSAMHEPYRTLVGHFRHEIGHYFWDTLVRDGGYLEEFRSIFGDDQADYAAALESYYHNGAPAQWQEHFISTYASAHPWEDWAESWAHYLHIVDTLEMAAAFGVRVNPLVARGDDLSADLDFDPYRIEDAQKMIDAWLPLSYAVNSINRSMGLPDLYPFVLSVDVMAKLAFIHKVVHHPKSQACEPQGQHEEAGSDVKLTPQTAKATA